MKHAIDATKFGPLGEAMATAVQTCVHCGFCLPACPTYQVLGQEMDSPRGRIVLMKEVLEGTLPLESALPHVDRCLGCLGCETACPSGVPYRDLISPFRQHSHRERSTKLGAKVRRSLMLKTLPYPNRFRWAARLGALGKFARPLMPRHLRSMLDLLPEALPKAQSLPALTPALGKRRARVALLAGCAQQVLAPVINRATLAVLSRNGIEIVIPVAQGCCGALAWHVGEGELAAKMARHNLAAFPRDVDAILTNAAGCGSGLHEYPLMLKGTDAEAEAKDFAQRVKDVAQFLIEIGITEAVPDPGRAVKVAYHDACHLSHAQGVRAAPRELLRHIPRLELLEIADGEICCGSAGTYNIDQPEIAVQLGQSKAQRISETGAEFLATGNIGCMTQIQTHLRGMAKPARVVHTMELLEAAYAQAL